MAYGAEGLHFSAFVCLKGLIQSKILNCGEIYYDRRQELRMYSSLVVQLDVTYPN